MKSASPIACLLLVLASCGDDEPEVTPTPGPIVFDDVTAASGVEFAHFNAIRNSVLPEDMGSGAAWGDVDGDGTLSVGDAIGVLSHLYSPDGFDIPSPGPRECALNEGGACDASNCVAD